MKTPISLNDCGLIILENSMMLEVNSMATSRNDTFWRVTRPYGWVIHIRITLNGRFLPEEQSLAPDSTLF